MSIPSLDAGLGGACLLELAVEVVALLGPGNVVAVPGNSQIGSVPKFDRSWDYRHSYQKALPKTKPRPASQLSASVRFFDAAHSGPRLGARLTKAQAEIKNEAPTEHLAAGQLRSQLCASPAGVRWKLGSAAIAGANGRRRYVHR